MTPEEKQLLFIDLCARLPYGVKIHVDYTFKPPYNVHLETDCGLVEFNVEKGEYLALTDMDNYSARKRFILENIKPYLRPMSSMTEKERIELKKLCEKDLSEFAGFIQEGHGLARDGLYMFDKLRQLDFLNSHGFDYRGLIPMGLALEAKERRNI